MAKKTALAGMVILALAAGTAHAQAGSLALNIEPQAGLASPYVALLFKGMLPGIDFGLRGTVHYYLTNSFSVNAGLGYAGNYHVFSALGEEDQGGVKPLFKANSAGGFVAWFFLWPILLPLEYLILLPIQIAKLAAQEFAAEHANTFFASYFTIPFGFRYAFKKFALGMGLTGNIPLHAAGQYTTEKESLFPETVTFKLKPYMGWYVDIDLPMKKRTDTFGMALRFSGSFAKETAEASSDAFYGDGTDAFNFFGISLLFQFGIPLARRPL